jgi:hypothetical protein
MQKSTTVCLEILWQGIASLGKNLEVSIKLVAHVTLTRLAQDTFCITPKCWHVINLAIKPQATEHRIITRRSHNKSSSRHWRNYQVTVYQQQVSFDQVRCQNSEKNEHRALTENALTSSCDAVRYVSLIVFSVHTSENPSYSRQASYCKQL